MANFGKVFAMLADVILVFDELVAQQLLKVSADSRKPRNSIHNVSGQMETVNFI